VTLKLRPVTWGIRAFLLLMVLMGGACLALPFFLTPPGYLVLIVHDRVFGSDILSHRAVISVGGLPAVVTPKPVKGGAMYDLGMVPSGDRVLSWDIEGYAKGERALNVSPMAIVPVTSLEADLQPVFGQVKLRVVDAVTNMALASDVEVRLDGIQVKSSGLTIPFTEIPAGEHGLSAKAVGYCPVNGKVKVLAGKTVEVTLPLSRELAPDEAARFVLQWTQDPEDIDAHLFVDFEGDKKQQHVYFKNTSVTKRSLTAATLDVDMRQPGGMETVTIKMGNPGKFEYLVHNYSRFLAISNKKTLPRGLSESKAEVRLYVAGECDPMVFPVPVDCDELVWAVAVVEVGVDGKLTVTSENKSFVKPKWQTKNK